MESDRVFDRLAERYDSWYDRNPDLFEVEVKTVPPPSSPSLEIGCGTGRFMQRLGIDVGVDISARMLEIARMRGCEVALADGSSLPFRSEAFSSIYLIFTLCFLDEPGKVLMEAWRVLRPGGSLVTCIVPLDSGLGKEYSSRNSPFYRIARFYREQEVREMLESSGFEVTEVKKAKLRHSENDFVCFRARKS
ncbi:class I SAM-dependent methyltransferase [Geoglobus ahangari]